MTEDAEDFDPEHNPHTCPHCLEQEMVDKAGHLLENASGIIGAFNVLLNEMEHLEERAYEETPEEVRSVMQTPYLTKYMRTVGLYNTLVKSVALFSPDDDQVIGYAKMLQMKKANLMGEFMRNDLKNFQADDSEEEAEAPPPIKKPIDKKLN